MIKQQKASRDHVLAVQGLRASGAAGKHGDRRTRRVRTRAAAKAAALKGW